VPDRVDEVALDRRQPCSGLCGGAAQRPGFGDGVEPWVEADLRALAGVALDPGGRRVLDQALDGEGAGVDLAAHLQRVAPVDEDERAVAQHQCHAGRAGEAGEPPQPLGARRHIFALMLVGARHQEAVEPVFVEHLPERGDAFRANGRVAGGIEGLEHGQGPIGRVRRCSSPTI